MRLLLVMLVGAVALAGVFGACGEGEEEVAPAPTTAGATQAATPTQAATTPTPASTTPASGTLTYVDPTYGYSFEYPADWFVHGDPAGGSIVTSYDPQTAKGIGGIPEGVLKVDVGVLAGQTIDSYVAQDAVNALPGSIEVLSDSNVTFAGLAGRVRDSNLGDAVARQYLAEFRGDVYMVIAYAATWGELQKMAHQLDLIVSSFRVDGQWESSSWGSQFSSALLPTTKSWFDHSNPPSRTGLTVAAMRLPSEVPAVNMYPRYMTNPPARA